MEVVKTLLGEGASVQLVDRQGNTALHYAAGYGRVDALRMLLDAGANAAEVNGNGKNALELVKCVGSVLDVVVVLVVVLGGATPQGMFRETIL